MNEIHIGDNKKVLEKFVLKSEKFKMIYIDPPYNTKSKFSFNDKKSSSDWISMMKSRLELASIILEDSGSIFISIDDNELYNLKVLCDSIFGRENFIGNIITKQAQRSNAKHINVVHEYILVYSKNKKKLHQFKIPRMQDPLSAKIIKKMYNAIKIQGTLKEKEKNLKKVLRNIMQEYGITWVRNYCNVSSDNKIFFAKDLSTPGEPREVLIPEINLHLKPLETRGWSSNKKFIELHQQNLLHFKNERPYEIHYLEDSVDNVSSILDFYSRQGTEDLKKLGLGGLFDTPKPVELIKYLVRIGTNQPGDRVLDFFAGSGTTAQAVLEVNQEDHKKLDYVLVQIDEKINKHTKSYLKCIDMNLNPTIATLMIYRINRFMKLNDIKEKYLIDRYGTEEVF